MEEWRLLLTGANDAYTNMSIDESVMRTVSEGDAIPTIRLYRWLPSAVSIGYFQGIREEVALDVCKAKGVDVVRRITGGGAVYHDFNREITYSVIVPESHPKMPKNIVESYKIICGGLIYGFQILGLNAEFKPINDICVNGKKISGSAHTRRYNTVLQHGTILCDVDIDTMFSLLKVPNEKIRDKLISSVKDRVTSIKLSKGNVNMKDVEQAMIRGFEKMFDVKLIEGKLSEKEKKYAKQLRDEKYATEEWNFKR